MSIDVVKTESPEPRLGSEGPMEVVPMRRPLQWVLTIACFVLAAMLVDTLVSNPRFQWEVVAGYFTAPAILSGLRTTLVLTFFAMTLSIVLGTILAIMRVSGNPVAGTLAWLFIYFFRGTPGLVQLIFWYNLAALYPRITLGIPFGPQFVELDVNSILTPFVAAVVGLGLNEAAYMAEIIRSGILSVDEGQRMAGSSLGMSEGQIMRRVVLPQAMRVIIPPTGNQVIATLKNTAVVSVIATSELLYSAQQIYAMNFNTIPLLIVASLWYLIVTTVLSIAQHFVEKHYSKGVSRGQSTTFIARLRTDLIHIRPKETR